MKNSKILPKNIITLTFLLILVLISIFTVTMVVNMQEIFSIPMFYFLLIVGYIIAIVGSIAIYRIIQQRRIPTFVKKAREMKKQIKKKKIIAESLLYPSKEEIIINKFGDRWSKIGLSLEDVIDIKSKKKEIT
ncbi:hypothetical protein LCGC14_1046450 [marine sediment metagenome]|uniref:Uncharacterized protein n=1 Tax=marine sediment metagenome TaxID=412755 RepID=A0A0F9MUL2_9ZZZZ